MNKALKKQMRRFFCWGCIVSLCISSISMAAVNMGDVYAIADGSLSLRVCGADSVVVCAYDASKNSTKELVIESGYKLVGQDGNIHIDDAGNQILFHVTEILDEVFAGNQTFQYINIKADSGMKIGRYAFENAAVEGKMFRKGSVQITGELGLLGDYAFSGVNVNGDMTIDNINGSIGAGAFQNMKLDGRLSISGNIDTLGDYALSGMSMNGLSMPAVIRHMGDGVYKDTYLGSGNIIPLSNFLISIGSKVFEGTNLAGIQLPEGDTVQSAAVDAFPDTEGMLIIIPEKLTNLEVFHFDQYKHLTFQTAEGLSDDSPVIRYLRENGLTYKKGENGQLVYPEPVSSQKPTETPPSKVPISTKEPFDTTNTPEPSPVQEPNVTPEPLPTQIPDMVKTPVPAQPSDTVKSPSPTKIPDIEGTPLPTQEPDTEQPPSSQTPNVQETAAPTQDPFSTKSPSMQEPPTPTESPLSNKQPKKNVIYTIGACKYRLLEKNKAVVVGARKKNSASISIPATVTAGGKLYRVVRVESEAFQGMKRLKKVKVGNYVKQIGDRAFAKCPKLQSIRFGTGLVSMGKKVLYQDKGLRKIAFKGVKLKKIGKKAFSGIRPDQVVIKVKKSKLKFYRKLIKKAK